MATKRWKDLFLGFLLFALMPGSGALANPLDPATQALVAAGDVDGIASVLAGLAAGGADLSATMEEVARLNPDIAGAVVNATLRNLGAGGAGSGNGSNSLGPAVQTLVAGAMSGVAGTISADQAAVYAENIATNVRQVIAAVAGGNQSTENALLASARSGVARSAAGNQTGASAQILRSDVSVRLQGTIDPQESARAIEAEPIVVSHGAQADPTQGNDGDQGQGQQQGGGDQGQQGGNQDDQQDGGQQGGEDGGQPQGGGQEGGEDGGQGQDGQGQGQEGQGQNPGQGQQNPGGGQNNGGAIVPPVDDAVQENPQVDTRPASPF